MKQTPPARLAHSVSSASVSPWVVIVTQRPRIPTASVPVAMSARIANVSPPSLQAATATPRLMTRTPPAPLVTSVSSVSVCPRDATVTGMTSVQPGKHVRTASVANPCHLAVSVCQKMKQPTLITCVPTI